jgi:hypothetical protein
VPARSTDAADAARLGDQETAMTSLRRTWVLVACTAALVGHAVAQPRSEPAPERETPLEALSRLERALERGVRAAATGIERGLKAAGAGVRAGAAATARGIERGAQATARAAERAARELERSTNPAPPPGSERTQGAGGPAGHGHGDA